MKLDGIVLRVWKSQSVVQLKILLLSVLSNLSLFGGKAQKSFRFYTFPF